ncbi:MAG: formate dehydrogenase accessory sulfurtransferase FdhD [Proteobacteria bacterium]|nr:formate dehydrogenase accessory sulfurtransferase FdhD [Pseudomonadota bacterium]MBU4011567.1 formate dehydrogenase accessory sulfurtransferase FdhD [Pseudomonadota bacterium]MBU4037801.1 formate dehydrogenase accessory sulfurtransferase FdhD [Pseudomonadota bacterium]
MEVIHWHEDSIVKVSQNLIGEEPLSIRIQGKPYSVVMRTPGEEIPHVAGFCLGEGIVDNPDDFASLAFCDGTDTNVVTATLTASRKEIVSDLLERRGFVSQTSCGLCGKELIQDLYQDIKPMTDSLIIDIGKAASCLQSLYDHQPLKKETHASHAAAIYNKDCQLLSVSEDVGRHNALDKAMGKLFLDKKLSDASFLVLSSRISFELVQKAARAKIAMILAFSRPTELAVKLAKELDMTIACLAKEDGLFIYCGKKRLKR